jgi:hypothetical protein
MFKKKYFLDLTDLQFKQVKLPLKSKLFRFFLWFLASVAVTVFYTTVFSDLFGSSKERMLVQDIENLKLKFSLLGMSMDNSLKILNDLKLSDEHRYRPVLEMDSIPSSVRKMGFGGTDRYDELEGYNNSSLLISMRKKVDEIKNMTTVQFESFKSVEKKKNEWDWKAVEIQK